MRNKCRKLFRSLKKLNNAQRVKLLAVIMVLVVGLGALLISTNKPITSFISSVLNSKNDSIQYAELEVTDAEIYTDKKELLTQYSQETVENKTIERVYLSLKFNIANLELYKDGKWQGDAIYHLPEAITAVAENSKGFVYSDGVKVGTFLANPDNIIIHFDEEEMAVGNIIYGDFSFWGDIDFSKVDHSSKDRIEFADDVYYDIQVNLCTQLELSKTVKEPVVNQTNSTITFNYEIKLYSPGSTHGNVIHLNDELTEIISEDGNIDRSSINVVWKDYDGNTKTVPANSLKLDGKKKITGTLPAMEAGDTITITYSVTEKADTWTNKTFKEANKARVTVSDDVDLEATAKSNSVNFVGDEWFDLSVKKSFLDKEALELDDGMEFPFEITIDSSIGTKNHSIDFNDFFTISEFTNVEPSNISIKNIKIYRVNGNNKTEITDSLTSSPQMSCSKTNSQIKCDNALKYTLQPLNKGEHYLIKYAIRVENATEENFTLTNNAKVKSDKLEDESIASASSNLDLPNLKIEVKTQNESYSCYASCGSSRSVSYGGTATFTTTINENNGYLKTTYKIEVEERFYSSDATYTIQFYDPDGTLYNSETDNSVSLPIHFSLEDGKFYAVDNNDKKFEMHSRKDKIVITTIVSERGHSASEAITVTLKAGEETLATQEKGASFGGTSHCTGSPCSRPPSPPPVSPPYPVSPPVCSDKDYPVSIEYSANKKNGEKVLITWKNKITNVIDDSTSSSTGTTAGEQTDPSTEETKPKDAIFYNFLSGYSSSVTQNESLNKDHYYTKEQIDKIQIKGISSDDKETILVKGTDYKIYAKACNIDSATCDNDYKEINEQESSSVYSVVKIEFLKAYGTDKYKEFTYEIESTAIVGDKTIANFSSSIFNEARYNATYCTGADFDNWTYENLPDKATDVLDKYNYHEDKTTSKSDDFSYMEDVDKDQIDFYYKVIINKHGNMDGDITFTDILPSGVILEQSNWSFGGKNCNSSYNCNNGILIELANLEGVTDSTVKNGTTQTASNVIVNYNEEENKLTVTIPETLYKRKNYTNPNYLSVVLYYKVHVVEEFERDINLVNKANVKSNNTDETDSATNRIILPKFDKYFDNYEERTGRLTYHVNINEYANTMLNGTTVDLIDTLTYTNYEKITNIKVEKVTMYELVNGKKGSKIGDISFKEEKIEHGIKLKMTIPDSKAIYLEYIYKIDLKDDYPSEFGMSNEIRIVGKDDEWAKGYTEHVSKITGITANAYTDAIAMSLTKADKANLVKLLANATYRVDKYTGQDWDKIGDFTTNEEGIVEIGEKTKSGNLVLFQNVAYRAKEIQAPPGYQIDPNYNYIYVYNPLIKREIIPEGFDRENVVNKNGVAAVADEIINTPTGDTITSILIIIAIICTLGLFLVVLKPRRYN